MSSLFCLNLIQYNPILQKKAEPTLFEKWLQIYLNKPSNLEPRTRLGLLAGIVGFISNLILAILKLFAGWLAGSVSIVTDAMNNLADTASSIVTIIGFRAASKPPDKEHPYGHERSEYISGLVISVVIIFVGLQFLITSAQKILDPSSLHAPPLVFVLLTISIVMKIVQGSFYRTTAKKIHSNALHSAAQDSFNDVYVTLVVLLASIIEMRFGWHIDGYAGFFLAIFIIYSGVDMIRKSINDLLGSRPDISKLTEMKKILDQFDTIIGFHDLLVHNYGPNRTFATIHIEIDDSWGLTEAHTLIHQIEKEFQDRLDIQLVCHVDPIAIQNKVHTQIYRQVKRILQSYAINLKFHDFQIISEKDDTFIIHFDVLVPDDIKETNDSLHQAIQHDIQRQIGDYPVEIEFDRIDLLKEL